MAEIWIHTVTIAALDPAALARFWAALLDYEVAPNHTDSVQIKDRHGSGPTLLFARASPSGSGRDKFHLDLRPKNLDAATRRARELGATQLDSPSAAGMRWSDPEGNRFCLLQSESDFHEFERLHGPGEPTINLA